jgi:hypothetical protein
VGVHRFAAVEFVPRLVQHIPAKGEVRVRYNGAYASRRRSAELLRRAFAIDVEVCRRCGGEMRILAFVTEHAVVTRILGHLELRGIDARAGPWAAAG